MSKRIFFWFQKYPRKKYIKQNSGISKNPQNLFMDTRVTSIMDMRRFLGSKYWTIFTSSTLQSRICLLLAKYTPMPNFSHLAQEKDVSIELQWGYFKLHIFHLFYIFGCKQSILFYHLFDNIGITDTAAEQHEANSRKMFAAGLQPSLQKR